VLYSRTGPSRPGTHGQRCLRQAVLGSEGVELQLRVLICGRHPRITDLGGHLAPALFLHRLDLLPGRAGAREVRGGGEPGGVGTRLSGLAGAAPLGVRWGILSGHRLHGPSLPATIGDVGQNGMSGTTTLRRRITATNTAVNAKSMLTEPNRTGLSTRRTGPITGSVIP